jgi:hypothetical protein
MPRVRRRSLLLAAALLTACGSGGGGGGAAPPPAPTVAGFSAPVLAQAGGSFTLTGTDFPGAAGTPVAVAFLAVDGTPFGGCGWTRGDAASAFVTSPTTVTGTVAGFALLRDASAVVEIDFGAGVVARSTLPIATFLGTANPAVDQDEDGVPDICDPDTLTFEGDAVGSRPAGFSSLDANPALLAARDAGGDRAAAYAPTGDAPYDRIDALRADFPQQDCDVFLDLEAAAGDFNVELWSDGSYRGLAGAGLIFQVRADGATTFYERLWTTIVTSRSGPTWPASGRVRLRLRKLAGIASEARLDVWNGLGWTNDAAVWPIADDRQYRGLDASLCNYWFGGATRGVLRMSVAHAIPAAPFSIARSPATSTDFALFQRDAAGVATVPLRLLCRPLEAGVVEARVVSSATGETLPGHDWGAHAAAVPARPDGLRVDLAIGGVPAGGNYDVQVRLMGAGGGVVSQQVLRDVAVGDVWIAAGQSNTSGYAGTTFGADAPRPEVHLFGNDGRWKEASEPMDDGADQTDAVSYEAPSCSFLLAFGKELFERTGVPVAVVPTPLGGTNLFSQWQRTAAHPAARQTLYGSMISRARSASPAAPPRGIVWFQGESDALSSRTKDQYLADLQAFVANARADLAAPGLAFLCGQLGTFDGANLAQWLPVQEALRQAPVAIPNTASVTAVDVPRSDSVHFNVVGYGMIGRRFATAARALVFGHPVDATDDLLFATGAGTSSVALTFESAVTGGAVSLFRVTDASGDVPVTGFSLVGSTVTLALSRALVAAPVVSYGWATSPTAPWLKDASGIAVPVFDGVPIAP